MKFWITALGLITIVFYASSFTMTTTDVVLNSVFAVYVKQLNAVTAAIESYEKSSQTETRIQLEQAHLDTRLAFKGAEPLLNYLAPTATKKDLNGSPLPWVKFWGGKPKIQLPKGLQTLDELVFSENTAANRTEIKRLVTELAQDFQRIFVQQERVDLYHQRIFVAVREELVRIFTLGLTGFDTPASQNALPEAAVALQSTAELLQPYLALLPVEDTLRQQITTLFAQAITELEAADDFAAFDRLAFLKKYINPLYGAVYDLHYQLGESYFDDPLMESGAVNYHAKNIFAEDFLRAGFYLKADLNNDLGALRAQLGERLFYDKQLSLNGKMSCATCHQPDRAFTDGVAKSIANDGKATVRRNAPTLLNAVYSTRYFYDLRERNLQNQMHHVVLDSLEFATDFPTIIKKMTTDSTYIRDFLAAYQLPNKSMIGASHIKSAIASYMANLTAMNSPFDQYVRGETDELAAAVKRGFNLFMGKAACGTCHFAPTFSGIVPPFYTDTETEVLGVPATKDTLSPQLDNDLGRYDSGFPIDRFDFYQRSFKTVTVRNVAETAPYMHNGVYTNLLEVVDFYNRGGGQGLGLEVPHQTLAGDALHLTRRERMDLVAFMEQLSDNPFIN